MPELKGPGIRLYLFKASQLEVLESPTMDLPTFSFLADMRRKVNMEYLF